MPRIAEGGAVPRVNHRRHPRQPGRDRPVEVRVEVVRVDDVRLELREQAGEPPQLVRFPYGLAQQVHVGAGVADLVRGRAAVAERHEHGSEARPVVMARELGQELLQPSRVQRQADVADPDHDAGHCP